MAAVAVHLTVQSLFLRRSPRRSPAITARRLALRVESKLEVDKVENREIDTKRRKGPLYALKSLILGFNGSTNVEYQGAYKRAVEKAEEIFFSVRFSIFFQDFKHSNLEYGAF
jgi:hypothetical protein